MKLKKIKPMYTAIVTTADVWAIDELRKESKIIDPKKSQGTIKEIQKVISIGSSVRSVKEGDLVKIRIFGNRKFEILENAQDENSVKKDIVGYHKKIKGYSIPTVKLNGRDCLMIDENDLDYVIEDWEEDEPVLPIIHDGEKHIIQ